MRVGRPKRRRAWSSVWLPTGQNRDGVQYRSGWGLVQAKGKKHTKAEGHPVTGSVLFLVHVAHPEGEVDIIVDFQFFDLTQGVLVDEVTEGLEVIVLSKKKKLADSWKEARQIRVVLPISDFGRLSRSCLSPWPGQ